jgi:hypothetical protein
MSKLKQIKPIDGFANVSDADVVLRGTSIQTNMTGNPNFPNPPVDLATLKAAIETFAALIAEALDRNGGWRPLEEKAASPCLFCG